MNIIETNVAIAANGRNTHACLECQLACVEFLENLVRGRERVTIDSTGLILSEYARHLNHSGQPSVGDEFFKYLHDNLYLERKVQMVNITENNDNGTGFDELPPNSMDPSDRKFLAVAIVSGAHIYNALDSDWAEHHEEIEAMGISVEQLCPQHAMRPIRG
ncbi:MULTISPECIES: hypothetical protein [Pseudomonas]|uniref:hypothetical protein n=1 Tax=Pseudomonas TaxID=286 RepID=UPI0008FAEA1A|nr:hypothetical protein [Pseudomonas aeruginosa]AUA73372.1 hypothetical protein CWI25_26365 [Pseudomonas aeruginosa]AUA97993.1 hypothetical protein CWI24_26885 [Pseudomonas aeruginosa]ELQ3329485.1 hypothetical protein [Pseudomonas aeruginosa]KAA5621645.1 hypothetical protein F3H11_33455 [Pseudomonas aeruginosa]KAA5637195.1 hypothetical protein F3G63_32410 [Pseudomonas aeruginosa]